MREHCATRGAQDWTPGWQGAFGTRNFFYVVGAREFFYTLNLAQPETIANTLKESWLRVQDRVPASWRGVFPGPDAVSKTEESWDSSEFGRNAQLAIAKGQPVSFPKAAQALRCLYDLADTDERTRPVLEKIRIEFANCYIRDFRETLASAGAVERRAVDMVLGNSRNRAALLEDMSYGFPVTDRTATAVLDALGQPDGISVREHSYSGDITQEVRARGYREKNTKRVARAEPVALLLE